MKLIESNTDRWLMTFTDHDGCFWLVKLEVIHLKAPMSQSEFSHSLEVQGKLVID